MSKDKLWICPYCESTQVERKGDLKKYWFCPRCMKIYKEEPPHFEIELDVGYNSSVKDPNGWLSINQFERMSENNVPGVK